MKGFSEFLECRTNYSSGSGKKGEMSFRVNCVALEGVQGGLFFLMVKRARYIVAASADGDRHSHATRVANRGPQFGSFQFSVCCEIET